VLGGDQRLLALELVTESAVVVAGEKAVFELAAPVRVGPFTVESTVGRLVRPVVDVAAKVRDVDLDQLGRRVRLSERLIRQRSGARRAGGEGPGRRVGSRSAGQGRATRRRGAARAPRSPAATTSACASPDDIFQTVPSLMTGVTAVTVIRRCWATPKGTLESRLHPPGSSLRRSRLSCRSFRCVARTAARPS
jgi:hypothetical protein